VRLDHIAFRVKDRWKTAQFYIDAFGYRVQEEFNPYDDDSVSCVALTPPERTQARMPFVTDGVLDYGNDHAGLPLLTIPGYHLAPEIFISDGKPDSVVGEWVKKHGSGIHHMAYNVKSVEAKMKEWQEKGWAKFLSPEPLTCPGITQVFTEELDVTGGIIYEFIERGPRGFCKENVRALMNSTREMTDERPTDNQEHAEPPVSGVHREDCGDEGGSPSDRAEHQAAG